MLELTCQWDRIPKNWTGAESRLLPEHFRTLVFEVAASHAGWSKAGVSAELPWTLSARTGVRTLRKAEEESGGTREDSRADL